MFLRRSPPRRTYATLGFMGSRHAANNKHQVVVGLRQEDPLRIWERRTPLTPEMVYELVREEGVRVLVQPCERRVFPLEEYIRAGAEPHFTLDPANIVVGIKEPPIYSLHTLPPGVSHDSPSPSLSSPPTAVDSDLGVHGKPRTYMMFSHTVKGQPYNMPLLSRFLGPKDSARLIDYELLTEDGVRSVGFGWFAGVAGALESMAAMGQTHLVLGAASPFLQTPRPHTHRSIESLRQALRLVGADISARGTPRSLGPCVFAVTGSGKVSQGVLSILEELPLQNITAQELEGLVMDPDADLHKVYLCHVKPSDYLVSKSGKPYSREDYYAHPDSYESHFHTKIAPYTTLLLNGTGWNPGFPRLMTNEQLAITLARAREIGPGRFASVGDISCDVKGGLEFLTHATTLSSPTFIARPPGTPAHLPGVQVMAVDILPATLPLDASEHFSRALRPYLHALVRDYKGVNGTASARKEDEKYLASLERATIAKEGQLVEPHGWLAGEIEKVCGGLGSGIPEETPDTGDAVASTSTTTTTTTHISPLNTILHKKRVLLLGSGMVAGPAVKELCRHADVNLVVASNVLHEANALASRYVNAKAVQLELPTPSLSPAVAAGSGGAGNGNLEQLVDQADLVISLLPVPFHPRVARVCLDRGKHLVTASYISPAMRDLHAEALQKDVLLMNEIGLDPGIDHVSATALLTQIRDAKKRVVSFTSFCGGLPAPDSLAGDGTGLGYKFSWSPRGVLGAALNGARFKLAGKDWDILGKDILKSHFPRVPIGGQGQALNLEGIANRDSLSYAGPYELGRVEELRTLLRGTLRYAGFSRLMHSFKQIGLLGTELHVDVLSWNDLARISLEQKIGQPIPRDNASFLSALSDVVPVAEDQDTLLEALDWLGLSPSSKHGLAVKPTANLPPIDLFTQVLANKLRYAPNERDLVVLSHEIVSRGKEHGVHEEEVHTSSLITYGDAEASAMARTVGLPVAFAALRILSGQITVRGVRGPSEERAMWVGVLADLEEAGLKMEEKTRRRGIEDLLASGLEERVRSV